MRVRDSWSYDSGVRSFTRDHLQRAARLALLKHLTEPDPERVIRETVETIAEDGERLYPRWTVLKIAARAIQLYHDGLIPDAAADRAIDEADA